MRKVYLRFLMILYIFFKDPDPADPWPRDPQSVGSALKSRGSPSLVGGVIIFSLFPLLPLINNTLLGYCYYSILLYL